MPALSRRSSTAPGLSFVLLCVVLGSLFVGGGASRGDVIGQVLVRTVAWIVLIVAILWGRRPALRPVLPVLLLLVAALGLTLMQLIPLPSALWLDLPGRAPLGAALHEAGIAPSWRPLSMVPGATRNAAGSLIVPFVVLILVAGMHDADRYRLPFVLVGLVVAEMLVGLLQFSGTSIVNPLVNADVGQVSGTFANRNHFALLMTVGCLLAPVCAVGGQRRVMWRWGAAMVLILLFILTILGSGSRAGIALAIVALVAGLALVRPELRDMAARADRRWLVPAAIAASVGIVGIAVWISIVAGRAQSITHMVALDPGQDMRTRGLPTVLAMIQTYLPWGTGLGSFDSMFRMHEPFALLKLTYFNHAHNDFLEIALDAGVAGLALLLVAIGWWGIAAIRAWRPMQGSRDTLARAGAAMLLLVFIASGFDYPARTPLMMAMIVIAGAWLATGNRAAVPLHGSALPGTIRHL